ncbi:PA2169 family four-helix-bundle protein [Sphingomonas sabuli]|uniref:PA2169 family four-helix-bundle protein n=1 Tax=Sphingomonas sabuli TaxID=2764186 RepID=A0A7G9L3F7_9SPHN|nr:PA2169 family four-helix-bundle protein [Sphingomonas sabuli]QNM83156.1 PA2169 family four-helix-bundle protein [Sphingomonas sabuli]
MSDENVAILNTLLSTTIDSVNGYENSAKELKSEKLREIFRQRADQRQQVVQKLREEVRRLGGDPSDSGSLLGKAHHVWEDLKGAITGHDEKAIINQVESAEDYIKGKYETALENSSGETRQVIETAYQSVREGHDQISQLKHGMETPS